MDDRFDEIFDDIPAPTAEDANRINPWRRPLTYIAWGIFLTTVTFNFLYLDLLLPPVGFVLLYLGLRSLRRENGGFRAAFVMASLRIAALFACYALRETPFFTDESEKLLTVPLLVLQTAQLVALRAGLAEVFDRTGTPRKLAGVNWLIAFNGFVALGALSDVGDIGLFGFALLAGYAAVIVAVARLPKSLGDAGCALHNAPVRLSDRVFSAVTLCALAAVTLAAWAAGLALSVPGACPFTPAEHTVLSGRIPAEIAEILPEEDAALFDEAENIQLKRFDKGRSLQNLDDIDLCAYTVTAQLSGARILILQYFRWGKGGPRYGDSVILGHSAALARLPGIRGALVYERGGETWTSPFAALSGGARSANSALRQTSEDLICGDIFVPMDAKNTRGYVMYTVSAGTEQWINYNCRMDYWRRTFLDSLTRPGSPTEVRFSDGFRNKNRATYLSMFSAWDEAPDAGDTAYSATGE